MCTRCVPLDIFPNLSYTPLYVTWCGMAFRKSVYDVVRTLAPNASAVMAFRKPAI